MTSMGTAYVLATLIYGYPVEDRIDALAECVNLTFNHCDEAKADLYAQLAEKLNADTGFEDARLIIEQSIDNTRKHFAGLH